MTSWRTRLVRLWHWLVLLLCLAGAAGAARLAYAGWTTVAAAAESGHTTLWWAITAGAVLTGLLFAAEAWRRVRLLHRG